MLSKVSLEHASLLPKWKSPDAFLILLAIALPLAFSVWLALLNNFVIEVGQFDGADIGLLHTIREIPGFLSIGVIAIIIFVREQVLAIISLLLLGASSAVTAWFPSLSGILMITFLSSIGFHYFETVNQSLQLQWFSKHDAPIKLGRLLAIGSGVTLLAYCFVLVSWKVLNVSYNTIYMLGGAATVIIAIIALFAYPQFESSTPQTKKMVLRRRYWLYYLLQFMAGARRQVFVVFAGFMMVERFGFDVHEITALYLINLLFNIFLAPFIGRFVGVFGERRALVYEYIGLTIVFLAYGGIYFFGWGVVLAAILYVLDHMFFALALAMKTYFQKIADPADHAPTAAVAFTINHIAAVFLPVVLGYLWLHSPASVFIAAAGMAVVSMMLALLIPRNPEAGNETIFCQWALTKQTL